MLTLKERAIQIVKGAIGDDLERANINFSYLDKDQMQREWGRSGKTPLQILDGYRKQRAEILEVIKWLEGIPC